MSLLINDNMIVTMNYKLTNDAGELLDSSEGREPLAYLHGVGAIIPGLEKALTGKVAGDNLQVRIEAAEGYGEVNEELKQAVDRAAFEGVESVEVGMTFQAQGQDGSVQMIVVTEVEGDQITVDANHPLAGVALNFDVTVVGVREATAEEMEQGQPQ